MARLSDREWMARFAQRVGSQRAAADQLGVSPSTVSKIIRGQRNGERYREAARAGANGRRVVPPPPTSRTPRRVRRPARTEMPDGRSRVVTKSARVAGREVERARSMGRQPQGFTVTLVNAERSQQYRHKSAGTWSGALTMADLTDDQVDRLTNGADADVLGVLREQYPWLGTGQVHGITWED